MLRLCSWSWSRKHFQWKASKAVGEAREKYCCLNVFMVCLILDKTQFLLSYVFMFLESSCLCLSAVAPHWTTLGFFSHRRVHRGFQTGWIFHVVYRWTLPAPALIVSRYASTILEDPHCCSALHFPSQAAWRK